MKGTLASVLIVAFLCTQMVTTDRPSIVESFLNMLFAERREDAKEPRDEATILDEYDFIVVGAGTAGAVVSNRLTENPNWKVLLIEAGTAENFLMDMPILANYLQFTTANWDYRTMPSDRHCIGFDNKECKWPRGKVMGGSSVLNYMIYTRGNRRDYDNWASLGNVGWSYDEVLPYFKKVENFEIPEFYNDKYHNKRGYLHVQHPTWHTPLAEAFVKAGTQAGFDIKDYNGETQVGVSYLQVSMKNGTRNSSNRAYLHPINDRKNLHVKKNSMVVKIIIDPRLKRAVGVEFIRRGRKYHVMARREVIVSAGTINSPQLLMLSGIGPRNHLEKLGIPVMQDLKVGYNLQDHIALGGLTFLVNKTVSLKTERIIRSARAITDYFAQRLGPLGIPGGCEALLYVDLNNRTDSDGYPDMELLFQGGSITSDPLLRKNFGITDELYDAVYKPIEKFDSWMVFPMLMRPKSKGRLMLKSTNPFEKPIIFANYFAYKEDLQTIVKGTKLAIELSKTPAFQAFGTRLHDIPIPGCVKYGFGTDKYWGCHARHFTFTIYHHTGTCSMGPKNDSGAVVDPRLRVYGIDNLRVIDASIMPVVPAAHTNAPTYMIAEKGADMIKEDWGYKSKF